ncbi:hypothetical protein Tco_0751468 [Tanacetum coccineum]|uniref:Uncharacterized protein n=1 Tax=Tanacetum coccineum TaxID=301880 RepID=A0ABQ4Z7E8_9ASTR
MHHTTKGPTDNSSGTIDTFTRTAGHPAAAAAKTAPHVPEKQHQALADPAARTGDRCPAPTNLPPQLPLKLLKPIQDDKQPSIKAESLLAETFTRHQDSQIQ